MVSDLLFDNSDSSMVVSIKMVYHSLFSGLVLARKYMYKPFGQNQAFFCQLLPRYILQK